MTIPARSTTESSIRSLDGILLFWVVLWLVVGGWTGYQIWQLRALGQSTVESGEALQAAARALEQVSSLPFIGDVTGPLGERVNVTAADIVESGHETVGTLAGLAILIGLAVALGPSAPVLLLYLPARMARRRDLRQLRTVLNERPDSPELTAYLAARAVQHLPVGQLLAVSSNPQADLAAGRHDALAQAELTRVGLRQVSR